MKIAGGVITALVTPFLNGEVDLKSLKSLIKHQLDNGIEGFVVSGSTGEAATLSTEEKVKALNFVLGEVGGKVPVLVGAGTFNTQETCELIKLFEKSKPDGFLLVTPYYNKPPQRGLVQHFLKTSEATRLPIVLYNVPGRTACTMSIETVKEISSHASHVVGIKEAAGDLSVIQKLVEEFKTDDAKKFLIFTGDDPTFLEAIGSGAHGVISVVSHLAPKLCVTQSRLAKTNKNLSDPFLHDLSEKIFCESNPIPVKWALREMGIIQSAEVRLPLVPLAVPFQSGLREAMTKVGIL